MSRTETVVSVRPARSPVRPGKVGSKLVYQAVWTTIVNAARHRRLCTRKSSTLLYGT